MLYDTTECDSLVIEFLPLSAYDQWARVLRNNLETGFQWNTSK